MLACISSAILHGVDGRRVAVEVHISDTGLPGFTIVGLPDAAVRESRDRVRAALLTSRLRWPNRKTTVNLAPSGVRKGGVWLDLPIAVGVLVASGQVPGECAEGAAFVGELGLDGSLRPVPGIVPLAAALSERRIVVPRSCAFEASLAAGSKVRAVSSIAALVHALRRGGPWESYAGAERRPLVDEPDLGDVRGQVTGRRALEVAAAGGHHLLLVGPPGSGKTMLARRLSGILPPLPRDEALEVMRIWSAAGVPVPGGGLPERPPFRAPHHGATEVALVGGGTVTLRPGEVSLAHTTLSQSPLEERAVDLPRGTESDEDSV